MTSPQVFLEPAEHTLQSSKSSYSGHSWASHPSSAHRPYLGQQEQGAAGAGVRVPLPQVEQLGRHDGGREEAQAQEAGDSDERHVLVG